MPQCEPVHKRAEQLFSNSLSLFLKLLAAERNASFKFCPCKRRRDCRTAHHRRGDLANCWCWLLAYTCDTSARNTRYQSQCQQIVPLLIMILPFTYRSAMVRMARPSFHHNLLDTKPQLRYQRKPFLYEHPCKVSSLSDRAWCHLGY